MKDKLQKDWVTGSGKAIIFPDLVQLSESYITKGAKVFIGSDSFVSNRKICFATAICLYGGDQSSRYNCFY